MQLVTATSDGHIGLWQVSMAGIFAKTTFSVPALEPVVAVAAHLSSTATQDLEIHCGEGCAWIAVASQNGPVSILTPTEDSSQPHGCKWVECALVRTGEGPCGVLEAGLNGATWLGLFPASFRLMCNVASRHNDPGCITSKDQLVRVLQVVSWPPVIKNLGVSASPACSLPAIQSLFCGIGSWTRL